MSVTSRCPSLCHTSAMKNEFKTWSIHHWQGVMLSTLTGSHPNHGRPTPVTTQPKVSTTAAWSQYEDIGSVWVLPWSQWHNMYSVMQTGDPSLAPRWLSSSSAFHLSWPSLNGITRPLVQQLGWGPMFLCGRGGGIQSLVTTGVVIRSAVGQQEALTPLTSCLLRSILLQHPSATYAPRGYEGSKTVGQWCHCVHAGCCHYQVVWYDKAPRSIAGHKTS